MFEKRQEKSPAYTDLPPRPDLTNLFWVDLDQLARIGGLVNSAGLPTMAIGVESRRSGLISPDIEAQLQPFFDGLPNPESGRKAFDVGVMYGTLLHEEQDEPLSNLSCPANPTVANLVADMAASSQGLDLGCEVDNYHLFMSLRDLEVDYAGTDVIAFCLAGTQDHIKNIFFQTNGSDTPPSSEELLTVQSMYYAGVLLGAIQSTEEQLPQTKVEIVRGRRDPVETVSARIEFDPGDDLSDVLDTYLRSKYLFKPVGLQTYRKPGLEPAISIIPNGMQFAPNAIDVPIYIPGLSVHSSVTTLPINGINAVLTKSNLNPDDSEKVRISLETDVKSLFYDEDRLSETEIIGLVVDNYFVSAVDPAHPWAEEIEKLIFDCLGIDEKKLEYCTELRLWEATSKEMKMVRRSTKFAAIFALAWPWLVDGVEALTGQNNKVEWSYNIPIDMLILGAMGVLHFGRKAYEQSAERERSSAKDFDKFLQEGVDEGILR